MKAILIPLIGIAGLMATAVVAQQAMRPQVPVVVQASGDADACNGSGIVKGLDPHGDGFLAVKSAPSLQALRIDKLYNGERVYLCDLRGDWWGVVYSKDRQDCNVSTPWTHTMPYTGPCRSGWAHRNWILQQAG